MMRSGDSPTLSLGRLFVLLAALTSVHGEQGQKPLNDDQKAPVGNDNLPSETFGSMPNEPTQAPKWPSRDAQLKIYLDPKYPCVEERGGLTTKIDLPVNTCASANFTLDSNVHLRYPGLCDGWTRAPYLAIYKTADCTGDVSHPTWYDRGGNSMGPGYCLSTAVWRLSPEDKVPSDKWSIMFHCTEDKVVTEATTITNISLPVRPPVVEKPKKPRPTFASVSDSACFISKLGMKGHPRFIFQKPKPDTCVNIAPLYMLKIYRNALCPNGTEALFAKGSGKDCRNDPVSIQEVDESLIANNYPNTCIDMGEEGSSYAFLCTGKLTTGKVAQSLFDDDDPDATHIHYSYGNTGTRKTSKSGAASNRIDGAWNVVLALCISLGLLVLF